MEFSRDDLMEAKRRVRAYAKELLQIKTPQLRRLFVCRFIR